MINLNKFQFQIQIFSEIRRQNKIRIKYSKIFRIYYGITELRKEFSKSRRSRTVRPHAGLRPHSAQAGFRQVISGNRKEIKSDLLRPHAQRVKIRQKYSKNRKEIGFGDLRGHSGPAPPRNSGASDSL